MSEDQLIERILALCQRSVTGSTLHLGIGDDAAVVAARPDADWVLSADAFLEGVHFLADTHADSIGYKALARATSDLAAMGATPRFFLLTLALPQSRIGRWLDDFLGGLRRAGDNFGMILVGGDTTLSPAIFISLTVVGEIAPGRAVTRSGASPGDLIFVTGTLGSAQLGLWLLKNHLLGPIHRRPNGRFSPLKAHLYPAIQHRLGAWLADHRLVSAMIDVSDGLSTDLDRFCRASGVGARIWADRLPCPRLPSRLRGKPLKASARCGFRPLELALHGGDDYELLFTCSRRNVKRLRRALRFAKFTEIGEIVRGRQVTLIEKDGAARRLVPRGWDPFRS